MEVEGANAVEEAWSAGAAEAVIVAAHVQSVAGLWELHVEGTQLVA